MTYDSKQKAKEKRHVKKFFGMVTLT